MEIKIRAGEREAEREGGGRKYAKFVRKGELRDRERLRGCGNVDKESKENKMSWRVNDLFEYVCYVPLNVINPIRLIKKLTQPAGISSRILPSPP